MRIVLLIVFGAAGTLARYGLDGWIQYRVGARFPAGTLTINLIWAVCFSASSANSASITFPFRRTGASASPSA